MLWGVKYFPFWHPFAAGDGQGLGVPITTLPFLDTVKQGLLPNVSFLDPAFGTEGNGTSADDHPLADIRLGERFIADTYHALASAGYLENTVLVVTFDEWGGFYDHVPPPHVIDDTNPANVSHTGDSSTPADGQLIPDYTQLSFRVPAIVISNLADHGIVHRGPWEADRAMGGGFQRPTRAGAGDGSADVADALAACTAAQRLRGAQRALPRAGCPSAGTASCHRR